MTVNLLHNNGTFPFSQKSDLALGSGLGNGCILSLHQCASHLCHKPVSMLNFLLWAHSSSLVFPHKRHLSSGVKKATSSHVQAHSEPHLAANESLTQNLL